MILVIGFCNVKMHFYYIHIKHKSNEKDTGSHRLFKQRPKGS
jgi:hypothetical protein